MPTIKEILSSITCKECGNKDPKNFILYFVMENGETKNYLSCLNPDCGAVFEMEKGCIKKVSDYVLDPMSSNILTNLARGG